MTQSNLDSLPEQLSFLKNFLSTGILPTNLFPLQGGSINKVYQIKKNNSDEVIKVNAIETLPGLFEAELNGLQALKSKSTFSVPEPLGVYQFGLYQILSMSFIKPTAVDESFWWDFGHKMSLMHKVSNENFGWEIDNYFATVLQQNNPCNNWIDFLITKRLEPMLRLNVDEGRISALTIKSFEKLYKQLDEIFPPEAPALLHGDLWSGNFIPNQKLGAVLIDPAVYFGHSEMDMAMTLLFGGFDAAFYQSYIEHYPLEKKWKKRAGIAQLYPLLYHSFKFGGNYIKEVKEIVSDF